MAGPRSPRTTERQEERSDNVTTATPAATEAKRVEVTDLDIYYGSFHAVKSVTMTVQPNKVTAIIGSSGCGKSTFLRSLNRMHELIEGARVEGSVILDGQDIYASDVDPVNVRRQVGMVFQSPNPFPTMSIADNVAAGLRLNSRKAKKEELDEVVERSLRGANLWEEVKDRLDRPGMGLSGGQQQRLCIARAIAVEPEVLLMDEPCSALDPVATLAIEDLIGDLKENYTIFNIRESGDPGELVELDRTDKIFSNPENKATEDYVSGRFG
jgi:phosphate transport system ATP-binding protein